MQDNNNNNIIWVYLYPASYTAIVLLSCRPPLFKVLIRRDPVVSLSFWGSSLAGIEPKSSGSRGRHANPKAKFTTDNCRECSWSSLTTNYKDSNEGGRNSYLCRCCWHRMYSWGLRWIFWCRTKCCCQICAMVTLRKLIATGASIPEIERSEGTA